MSHATLLTRFERSCAAHPDRDAFVFADRTYTYREFAGIVQGIRELLDAQVPATETRIGIFATQDVWTYASIIAVLATGRAYVPLNPKAPADRNLSCVDQADLRTLLCGTASSGVERLRSERSDRLQVVETSRCATTAALAPIAPVPADAMAYLLFTSGSTGVPKGVPISHANVNAFLEAFVDASDLGFTSADRFLQMFDLTFDLSVISYGVPLCVGGACHVVPDGGPGFIKVFSTLTRGAVTVALMVPSVLTFLERYFDESHLPALRLSLFCGEALPVRLARAWWKVVPNARLLNVYGPTEATIFCSSFELGATPSPDEAYNGVVSIGQPMPGTQFRVIDEAMADVPVGEKGELVILGAQVTDRYWQNPEKTAAAFVTLGDGSRGYRSGDVVFVASGAYFYCGRTDNQLKVDGYRVEAGEIEHHARRCDGVRDAALVGHVGASGGTVLHLFVLADAAVHPTVAKTCRAALAERLPPYMVPQKVHPMTAFPLNANGKVDRKALLASLETS